MTDPQPGPGSDDADPTGAEPSPAAREDLLRSIRPDDAAANHEQLRSILAAETRDRIEARDGGEFYENLYWCAFLLSCVGDPADVPALWEAKQVNFDTSIGLDVEALFGAGLEATLDWLRTRAHDDLAAKLATYDPASLDLDGWRADRTSYFC